MFNFKQKEDEFFGKQTVYHRAAQVNWPYKKTQSKYKLTLSYQGCAEVGVCYPPVDTVFDINGNGFYSPQTDMPISGKDRFLSNPAQPVSSDGLHQRRLPGVAGGQRYGRIPRQNACARPAAALAKAYRPDPRYQGQNRAENAASPKNQQIGAQSRRFGKFPSKCGKAATPSEIGRRLAEFGQ